MRASWGRWWLYRCSQSAVVSRTSCSDSKTYDPRWAYAHMLPEQVVRALLNLRGRQLLPIRNGTFDMAMHT